jgi:Spy/CpxP family protein refolding chaperone
MRKVLLPLAAAASVLAVASPASAQAYGNLAPGYGYGQQAYGYGNAYGYGYGNMQAQLQQIRNQAYNLMRQGRLTRAESRDLNRDIRNAERAINRSSRYGISPNEARSMQTRIANLQYEVRRYADYDGQRYYRGH